MLKLLIINNGFSREVLKFVKFSNQKTKCLGHGHRIIFRLPCVFESGFQKNVDCNEQINFRNIRLTGRLTD